MEKAKKPVVTKAFADRCYNGGERHDFRPRFDTATFYQQRYVCDICTWCGKVVERPEGHPTKIATIGERKGDHA